MKPKYILIISPILSFFLVELIIFQVEFFYWIIIGLNLLIAVSLYKISRLKLRSRRFRKHLILPFFFLNGLSAYLLLSSNTLVWQLLAVVLTFFVYYYLRQIYFQYILEMTVRWDNLSYYFSFLALFFVFSFVFGSQNSLLSSTTSVLVFLLTAVLLTYQVFWAQGLLKSQNYVFIFLIALVLVEIAWVFFYLPFSYNIGGIIIAIFYYLILGLTRPYLKNSLTGRKIKFYLSLSLGCVALILLTARIF